MNLIQIIYVFILTITLVSCGGDKNPYTSNKKGQGTQTSTKKNSTNKTKTISSESAEKKSTKGVPPAQLKKALALLDYTSKDDINSVDGKKIFKLHCSICHGFKGNMMVNGAKDLTKSSISIQEAVAQVYHGKGLMQPYKGILTDAEIIAVSNYTKTLKK